MLEAFLLLKITVLFFVQRECFLAEERNMDLF